MIFPTKKNQIPTILKSIVGDGYFFSGKPIIQSDGTLKWNGFFDAEQAQIFDGTYLLLDGVDDYTESELYEAKTWVITYKNIASASDLALGEIVDASDVQLATINRVSGEYVLTGFDNPVVQAIIDGDWITLSITADTAIEGKL